MDSEDNDEHFETKRGAVGQAERERIQELHQEGHGVEAIASHMRRTQGLVEKILGLSAAPPAKARRKKKASAKKGRASQPAPAERKVRAAAKAQASAPAPVEPSGRGRGRPKKAARSQGLLLSYRLWLRPDLELKLELPSDLSEAEAVKLADIVRHLHFGG